MVGVLLCVVCVNMYVLAKSSLIVLGYSKVKSLYGGGRRGRV